MRIGIIGVGMVGGAVLRISEPCVEISALDIKTELNRRPELMQAAELCFICVPTPTGDNAVQDVMPLEDALCHLLSIKYAGVVVVKSTVLPGTMNWLKLQYKNLRLVHNPEFLCEKTADRDYALQKTLLASGAVEDVRVLRIYADLCLNIERVIYSENYLTTEWAKYIHNCVLPVKLSFLNEIHEAIGNQGVYDEACEMAEFLGNLGTHWRVPGPDGECGWGGACFPKDTIAMAQYLSSAGVYPSTLVGAIETNRRLRK